MDTLRGRQTELTNWSKSARSACVVYPVREVAEIGQVLARARAQGLPVIPHGAGHSYTDAALNTGGVVIDLTPMRQIRAWDPATGIMRVEAGATLRDVVETAAPDGWWPAVSPSTPEATVGGCAAMNVTGRNAWKCDPFGAAILALEVVLASGEALKLTRDREAPLLRAFVGSLGLLGIITSITLQLQRIPSGAVNLRRRPAGSLAEVLAVFAEEEARSDFMEAWLDGLATGRELGRGLVTCATLSPDSHPVPVHWDRPGRLKLGLVRAAARLGRPALGLGVPLMNRLYYGWNARHGGQATEWRRGLFEYTYWPAVAAAGYHALLPEGVETFQAFVPRQPAREVFEQAVRYSQQQGCWPIWCIIKQHRRDPFLLSYQVDGFSLELVYARRAQPAGTLEPVLRHMIASVIEAGGRFYLAKDALLTQAQYRQSVGAAAVDGFLELKRQYDPDGRLQSDLFQRVFQQRE